MGVFVPAVEDANRLVTGELRCGTIAPAGDIPLSDRPALLADRSEEHTSELQSLMRNSYAVFCLKKKNTIDQHSTSSQIYNKILTKTSTNPTASQYDKS